MRYDSLHETIYHINNALRTGIFYIFDKNN